MPAEHSLRRRLAGALSLQSVAILVTMLQEIILVPVFLSGWGTGLYRDWLVLLAAAEFLALLDLGLQTYFGNLLMARAAADDEAGYRRVKGLAFATYLTLVGAGLLALASLALLVPAASVHAAFGTSPELGRALLPLLGLWVVLRLPPGLLVGVYRARGEPARGILFQLLLTLARILGIAVPILLGGGPVDVAVALIVLTVTITAAALWDQRRRYGERWPAPRPPGREELRELFSTGLLYNLTALAVTVSTQGMVLMIAQVADDALTVVIFTTARTITGLARQVSLQLAMVVGVEQSRERGGGRHAELLKLHRFVLRLAGAVAGGLGGLILVVGDDLLTLWTQAKVPYEATLFLLLLLANIAGTPARAAAQLLYFTNRPGALAASLGTAAAVALTLTALFVPQWGAAGAAAALLVAELVAVSGGLGAVVAREMGEGWSRQWRSGTLPALIGFTLGGGGAWALHHAFGGPEWWRLIAVGAAWAALAVVPTLYIILSADHRRRLLEQLR